MKLRTKQEDEVILCKNPEGKTFGEIYNNILEKTEVKVYNMPNNQDNYEAIKVYGELKEGELLKDCFPTKYSITTGSGRSKGDYTVVIKP